MKRPGESQPFLRGSLHIDLSHIDHQGFRDIFPHGIDMRAHLRCLCNDRCIDIFDKHMILFQQLAHFFQQFYGRNTLVRGICIREMFPDVPQRRCSQQRIHDRMEQDIRIRMSQKTLFIRYFHAATSWAFPSEGRHLPVPCRLPVAVAGDPYLVPGFP